MKKVSLWLVDGVWRYSDTTIDPIDFVAVGSDLEPSGEPNSTYSFEPKAQATDYDDSNWRVLAPAELETRRSTGQVCFNWQQSCRTAMFLTRWPGD